MSFDVANKEFEAVFGKIRGPAPSGRRDAALAEFVDMLSEYLRGRREWSALAIRSWIKSGRGLSAFRCREDVMQPMIDGMTKSRIPFVLVKETTGNSGFLIRECDTGKVDTVRNDVLDRLSNHCDVTTGEQAGIIYRRKRIKDKSMLVLTGLTAEEVYYLEEEARDALPGDAVGIDLMGDGTYMLTCHGKSAMGEEKEHPFKEALIEAKLIASGATEKPLTERNRKRLEYIAAKAAGFPDKEGGMDEPVWIVGNGESFVKRTTDGFESGHAEKMGDEIYLVTDYAVPLTDADYDMRLNSALSRITGHFCLYRTEDVIDHFRDKKDVFRDPKEIGKRQLVRTASSIVEKRKGAVSKKSWKAMMEQYRENMVTLIVAAKEGRVPAGYMKTDILQLRRIINTFGIDRDISIAAPILHSMLSAKVFEREAGPARIASIEAVLAQMRGEEPAAGIGQPSRDRDRGTVSMDL